MNYIGKGTRETYGSRWCWFQSFCGRYKVNFQVAPLPLVVKFILHMCNTGVSYAVLGIMILPSANIKSQMTILVWLGLSIPWLQEPRKPLTTKTSSSQISGHLWHKNYPQVLENLGKNKTLILKQLSLKTVFLVTFSTLSRCSFVLQSTQPFWHW